MPQLKLKHVVSCSSEDPNNPADNLLGEEVYRKWKGANPGEKQLAVVVQLEKSSLIHSIDIGNDGSAFVEVLVGRSSSSEEYQVLLVASAFMSPAESKSWTNTSRVRMFGKEKLSQSTVNQKWDLVKIVCTQPFNKKEKYGLSFIKLSSPADKSTEDKDKVGSTSSSSTSGSKKIGGFSLRDEEPVPSAGSMLFKKSTSKEEPSSSKTPKLSVAAHAKAASLSALKKKEKTEEEEDRKREPKSKVTQSKPSPPQRKAIPSSSGVKRPSDPSPASSSGHAKRKKKGKKGKEFGRLLSKVTFVLSGFKNPFRGELRDKAVAMGAHYEPDWGPTSTHLVCAFSNTPKFNEVKKKGGKIVKKEWILDCYQKKQKLPTNSYRMIPGSDSEDTSSSEDESPPPPAPPPPSKKTDEQEDMDDDPYGGSTDEEIDAPSTHRNQPPVRQESSDDDTDDEIQRIQAQQRRGQGGQKDDDDGIYSGSTDIDSDEENNGGPTAKRNLLNLPTFFSKCHFLLYGSFDPADRRQLTRYITAYDGHIENYMGDRVTHVVSNQKWDSNFDEALKENASLTFISPGWVFACHNKQKMTSPTSFRISK